MSYDHPFHIRLEHALNIDFVNEAAGPGARVAVELTPEAARQLAHDDSRHAWKRLKPTDLLEETPAHVHSH